uniref:Synenkephalin n=1 Tax=Astyanax mexicanus TaxID=7994 RepID=A0A8B9J8N7_ASTMX
MLQYKNIIIGFWNKSLKKSLYSLSGCIYKTVYKVIQYYKSKCLRTKFRLCIKPDGEKIYLSLSCTLACGGSVDSRTLEPCRDVLTEEERVAVDGLKLDGENPEHLLSKKYGGFMKRYGGFMMKKAAEVSGVTGTAESDRTDGKYGGFMKKDGAQGASASEEQMDLLREILRSGIRPEEPGRDLHKRYGGFMRRVGRPQWLDDHKGYGMYKRWDDGGETAVPDKRYGGFMD